MSAYILKLNLTVQSDSPQLLEDVRTAAYADFDSFIKSGVFSFKNGVAEIHRDQNGKVGAIYIKERRK
mgnify:CR=1 FL=1